MDQIILEHHLHFVPGLVEGILHDGDGHVVGGVVPRLGRSYVSDGVLVENLGG